MFLTRLGINSKAVITGDETQIDLPGHKKSGLLEAHRVLDSIEGIAVVEFSRRDVVRHPLVQRIIAAYESRFITDSGHGLLIRATSRRSFARLPTSYCKAKPSNSGFIWLVLRELPC